MGFTDDKEESLPDNVGGGLNRETQLNPLDIPQRFTGILPRLSEYLPYCSLAELDKRQFFVRAFQKASGNPNLLSDLSSLVKKIEEADLKEPSRETLLYACSAIEQILDMSFEEQMGIVFQDERVVTHLRNLTVSRLELIDFAIGYKVAKKKGNNLPTILESKILSCRSREAALSLIRDVTTGAIATPEELKPIRNAHVTESPLLERITLAPPQYSNEKNIFSVSLHCLPNERVEIIGPDGKSKKILDSGSYSLEVQLGSIIRSVITDTGIKTTLMVTHEGLSRLASSTDKDPVARMIQKVSDQIWKGHELSLSPAQIDILYAVASCAKMLEAKQNNASQLLSLAEKLREFEKTGFPPRLTVEVIDVLTGHSTGGLLLEPSVIMAIEKKGSLTTEQWSQLLAAATSKEKLHGLLQAWSSNGTITSEDAQTYIESSAGATPGHNIAQLAKLFDSAVQIEQPKSNVAKRIAAFCYTQKALPQEKRATYTEFKAEVVKIALPAFNQNEGIEIKAELLSRVDAQEITLKWLYAEVTNSFQELFEAQIEAAFKLNLRETTGIIKRNYTKLRYDIEQSSLIFSFSLSEILSPELHHYIQMRAQQGTFFTEYALPLTGREDLRSLLELLKRKAEKTAGHLEAKQVQEILFEWVATDPSQNKENEALQELLEITVERYVEEKYPSLKHADKRGKIASISHNARQILSGSMGPIKQTGLVQDILRTQSPAQIDSVTRKVLQEHFSHNTAIATILHGWGANSETAMPFLDTLAQECTKSGKNILVVAPNYMGASGSNQFPIEGLEPATFSGAGQVLGETYAEQLVPILHKFNGASSEEREHFIIGHSMGGHVAIAAALVLAASWRETYFAALEPVISNSRATASQDGEIISHYIALLGSDRSTNGDSRPVIQKIAAELNRMVTTGEVMPSQLQEILVFLGRVGINQTAYAQLVRESDPRAAHAHAEELAQWLGSFHTHATQMLEHVRSFTTEEKRALLEIVRGNQLKIVLATGDDVLKWIIGFNDFFNDPLLSASEKNTLRSVLLLIVGNHYGHLQPDNQIKVAKHIIG